MNRKFEKRIVTSRPSSGCSAVVSTSPSYGRVRERRENVGKRGEERDKKKGGRGSETE